MPRRASQQFARRSRRMSARNATVLDPLPESVAQLRQLLLAPVQGALGAVSEEGNNDEDNLAASAAAAVAAISGGGGDGSDGGEPAAGASAAEVQAELRARRRSLKQKAVLGGTHAHVTSPQQQRRTSRTLPFIAGGCVDGSSGAGAGSAGGAAGRKTRTRSLGLDHAMYGAAGSAAAVLTTATLRRLSRSARSTNPLLAPLPRAAQLAAAGEDEDDDCDGATISGATAAGRLRRRGVLRAADGQPFSGQVAPRALRHLAWLELLGFVHSYHRTWVRRLRAIVDARVEQHGAAAAMQGAWRGRQERELKSADAAFSVVTERFAWKLKLQVRATQRRLAAARVRAFFAQFGVPTFKIIVEGFRHAVHTAQRLARDWIVVQRARLALLRRQWARMERMLEEVRVHALCAAVCCCVPLCVVAWCCVLCAAAC